MKLKYKLKYKKNMTVEILLVKPTIINKKKIKYV